MVPLRSVRDGFIRAFLGDLMLLASVMVVERAGNSLVPDPSGRRAMAKL
jgi:hypothetical protein